MNHKGLTIIVPTYNEEKTIEELLLRINAALTQDNIQYEVIIVDDHSNDKTVAHAQKSPYPVKVFLKKGKKGKAYSILEGHEHASYDYIAYIDGDLQYPPELLPSMYQKALKTGVSIAHRKTYKSTLLRRVASRANAFVFGRLLLGLAADVQSGCKIFHKEVFEHTNKGHIFQWSIDIPLLFTAHELGYTISHEPFDFVPRKHGESNVRFLQTAFQIAKGALLTRFAKRKVYKLKPHKGKAMLGAGIAHKRKRYVTHTSLPHHISAYKVLTNWQITALISAVGLFAFGLLKNPMATAMTTIAALSTIYFIDVIFNFFLVLKSLYYAPEIRVTKEELQTLKEKDLPVYSILCPLYKEAHVIPQFLKAIETLDYPKEKLDVLLLLEEDDEESQEKVKKMSLPSFVRTVVVPHSFPKTKPKACNYGLGIAKGEYIVIYDAEDQPEALQLKKAYIAFQKLPKSVACLQAKLNYYNPHDNLLTRLFTAEYSLWFDVTLPGLQTIETGIPLGGTSNHFRTSVLHNLEGWDAFNVTEDCDLGTRLFQKGYKTAMIESTTLEEANNSPLNWIRQRSRWVKGYIQTYLVHMRNPVAFAKNHGIHALIFHLVVGGKIAFMLINPFLWAATIAYFSLYAIVGPTIESLYPSWVFYFAAISLVFGNFLFLYYYMIGTAKKGHWGVMKYVYLVPLYWLMVSVASFYSVIQLILKPHYWEKTKHGLTKTGEESSKALTTQPVSKKALPGRLPSWQVPLGRFSYLKKRVTPEVVSGAIFISALLLSNAINFFYSAYLGREVSVSEFGIISLMGSILYLSQIPIGAFGGAITHKSAYLLGKHKSPVKDFWRKMRKHAVRISLVLGIAWILVLPFMRSFFQTDTIVPFLLFTPIWVVGVIAVVDNGFLSGNLKFMTIAAMVILESTIKMALTVILVTIGRPDLVYAAIPAAMICSFFFGWLMVTRIKEDKILEHTEALLRFPKRFFATGIMLKLSNVSFLTFDVLFAKHYLVPEEAGRYALIALVGKIIYFFGLLFSQFVNPLVSRQTGAGKDAKNVFRLLFTFTAVLSTAGFITLGVLGSYTVPILFGPNADGIIHYLPYYTLGMAAFTISTFLVSYHQARREYLLAYLSLAITAIQVIALQILHQNLLDIVLVMSILGIANLVVMGIGHLFYNPLSSLLSNALDFVDLFGWLPKTAEPNGSLRILIFNWRDTKHVWSGGAEAYIHELAKEWVHKGHKVTVFCGNDGKSKRNEKIDGVQMVRRGGFFTVYIWAFLYYMLRFRGNFDVVIDSENGVPFFTPLYVRERVFLLIHHVHQGVFREHLKFPWSAIARVVESKLMPIVYRKQHIITVSESSRQDILKLQFVKEQQVHVVQPGIDTSKYEQKEKTTHASFLYLGRLKPYKNVDIAIHAFAKVYEDNPNARLTIAGEGEHKSKLKKIAQDLNLNGSVQFLGRVTEEQKASLLAKSWAALQPSSFEGWSLMVLEANASGTPVIASNVHGLRDSVVDKKTGLLFEARNIELLTSAMKKLSDEKQLRLTLSSQAYAWSRSFSWERSAHVFIELMLKQYYTNSAVRHAYAK